MSHPVLRQLAAVIFAAALIPSCFAQSMLRVRADHWMPFNGDPADPKPGYAVDILRAVFEPQEIKVRYETCGWEEALVAVRAGKIEAVIGANSTEAQGLVLPKENVGAPRVALWVKKSNPWTYLNLASLNKVKVGAIAGYSYWESLDGYIESRKTDNVILLTGENPLADGIAKLNAGEIDVIAETVPVFVWTLKAAGFTPSDYRIAYTEIVEPIYVAFANNDIGKRRAAAFDEGIQKLRTSGELARILKSYGLSDWK